MYASEIFLASAPLPDPQSLQTEPANQNPSTDDPLIAKGWENIAYTGAIFVIFGVLVVIGIFSRRIEYVIAIAATLSLVLIAILFFTAL